MTPRESWRHAWHIALLLVLFALLLTQFTEAQETKSECLGTKGVTCEALARVQAEYITVIIEARNLAESRLAEMRALAKAAAEPKKAPEPAPTEEKK